MWPGLQQEVVPGPFTVRRASEGGCLHQWAGVGRFPAAVPCPGMRLKPSLAYLYSFILGRSQ